MLRKLHTTLLLLLLIGSSALVGDGKHLFILSGQSNMKGLDPDVSFTPRVGQAFGDDRVIVVKLANGGIPIRMWYKDWKPAEGREVKGNPKTWGKLYDRMMREVMRAIEGEKIVSVTFVWMQGERDAKEGHGEVYGESFQGVIRQLTKDLGRDHVNFVIGRLSDMDMENKRFPHWTMIRDIQVKLADNSERGAWVDTDDLKMKEDQLHYSAEGYALLGQRFAEAAIQLIQGADRL